MEWIKVARAAAWATDLFDYHLNKGRARGKADQEMEEARDGFLSELGERGFQRQGGWSGVLVSPAVLGWWERAHSWVPPWRS